MKKISIKELIEGIGVFAVVASLIFVGLELRQDRLLGHASQGSLLLESLEDFDRQFSDPAVARIYVKMISNPAALNIEEKAQANALLDHIVRLWIRDDYLYQLAIFDENQRILDEYAERMFGNPYAKAWWEAKKGLFGDFADRITRAVDGADPGSSLGFFSTIQQQLEARANNVP